MKNLLSIFISSIAISIPTSFILLLAATGTEAAKCPCTKSCPTGQTCIAIPKGCREICVVPRMCGGIAGIQCDDGFVCIDNPNDNCDPLQGGNDCGGVCIPG